MKKILELCLSPDLGGLELFMVRCYNHFSKKNKCTVAVAHNKKLDDYINGEKFYLKRSKIFPFIPALKLAKFIDKHEIDIVHFHWTRDIITAVLAKKFSKRKPKIIQTRNMMMTRFKSDFYHKWLYKNIDMIHAVTNQVKEQLLRFIPEDIQPKVKVVYMGTNIPTKQLNIDDLKQKYNLKNEFVVGIVGRIEEAKGQWLVIEALNILKDLNIKALIVGNTMDKTYLNSLKDRVKELGLEGRVIFTGFTKEVDKHFALMDINVLATPKETFGLVVIEAMANNVAMIATNRGGPLEIIEDKVDGLLFDRNVDDLAKKIELLYNNKELLENISKNGFKKVNQKFNEIKQLEKLYGVINEM